MTFKDILVHMDSSKPCGARLELAIKLAGQQQARLAGIYVVGERSFFSREKSSAEAEMLAASKAFDAATAAAGVEAEWLSVDAAASGLGLAAAINLHAHYRDLVILGQHDPESGNPTLFELPERGVLGAGRPVLIVPYAGQFETIGRRVLLAWRGGPESARALNDALPFLRQARQVQIISVKTGDDEIAPISGDLPGYLARHGIQASYESVEPDGLSVGDMLLNRAADHGSDLLVMGAFAQSRRGIPGLGEVGRHLLKCMTIPVLMSH